MIRSEIIENDGPSKLVGLFRDVVTSARNKLAGCTLDQTHFGRAYIRSQPGERLYVVSAHFLTPLQIDQSIIISGVQLAENGKASHELATIILPSNPELLTPERYTGFGLSYCTRRGVHTLAEELRTGTLITRGEYFAHLPRMRTLLND